MYLKKPKFPLNYLDLAIGKNFLQQRSLRRPPNVDNNSTFTLLADYSMAAYCLKTLDVSEEDFTMVPYVVNGLKSKPLIQVVEMFQAEFLQLKDMFFSRLEELLRAEESLIEKIYFTGWGIGGALAVIAALTWELESYIKDQETPSSSFKLSHFQVEAITFGAPRLGNTYFARLINKFLDIKRVTYLNDHVPHFPGREIAMHHELEIWIDPNCDCSSNPVILECPGFDYTGKAPRQVGVSDESFFPDSIMSGENQECNAGQSIVNVPLTFIHDGPYFGYHMRDCGSMFNQLYNRRH
ncbi:hypothetical protein G9A89_017610 [Geosiphon pyriformis]|nr:hypothetical protein G9A89_017610 [Geosiphon pyriformis]